MPLTLLRDVTLAWEVEVPRGCISETLPSANKNSVVDTSLD